MDIQPTNQQPISDDQELAKVLAGLNQQADEVEATPVANDTPAAPSPMAEPAPLAPTMPEPMAVPAPVAMPPIPVNGDLESIKQNALTELRPLVDKLNVAPEEKFDTYLLLLRSTDDQALIPPAFEAARSITDEARRAQALLDIIKEIDYLAGPQQPAA
ncbi:MAG: hypothetical protein JWP06_1136 [Candidatus Saccharibacteria bacterium]|nr:hypothetical protein [Candidatus Saccharibacteria bacterium]